MEIIQSDSALAFEMVSLLSRGLNATQNKIRGSAEEITGRGLDLFLTDLLVIQHFSFQKLVCHKTDTERAEAAEIAVSEHRENRQGKHGVARGDEPDTAIKWTGSGIG